METINPCTLVSLLDAFILVCSTTCIVYVLTKHYSFQNLRIYADALFRKQTHLFRCSLCLGLWVGLLNGIALIGSKYLYGWYHLSMIIIDSALTVALIVFIINVLINYFNVNKRNQRTPRSRRHSA